MWTWTDRVVTCFKLPCKSAFWLGWPHGPFLRDAPLPGFLYCLKYKKITLVSYNDRCAASSRMNEQTRAHICIALIVLTFLSTTIGWLCKIPACYWSNYSGCFSQYRNPGKGASHINGTNGHPTSGTGGCVVCLRNRLASRTRRLIRFSLYSRFKVQGFFICHMINYTGYNQKWNVGQIRSTQWTVQRIKNNKIKKYKSNTTQEHIYI